MTHRRFTTGEPGRLEHVILVAVAFIAVAAASAIVGFVIIRLRVLVVAAVIAMMVASGLDPATSWLERRGLRRGLGSGVVLTGLVTLLTLLVVWMVPQLWASGASLGEALSSVGSDLEKWLATGPLHVSVSDLRSLGSRLGLIGSGSSSSVVQGIVSGAVTVAEFLEGLVLAIVFTVFLSARGIRYADWAVAAVSAEHHQNAARLARVIWSTMGAYARAIACNGAVNAVLLGIAMAVLGVPAAGPLAVIAFLGGFFPVVGTITAGLLAALVSLAANGLVAAIVMVAVTAVLHHLEVYIVGPLIVGRLTRVHPAALVAALATGATVAGIAGLFLAPPLLVLGVTIVREVRHGKDIVTTLATDESRAQSSG